MAQCPTHPSRPRALLRLLIGLIALAAVLVLLVQLGYVRVVGTLEVALTDAGGRPVPCALVLPELVAPWPAWAGGAGARAAIGIASNAQGIWRETLPPGTYRLQTSIPALPPQPDLVVYPWRTTRLAVRLPPMAPPPALLSCPAAIIQPPPGGRRTEP